MKELNFNTAAGLHTCLKGQFSWLLSISRAKNIEPSPAIKITTVSINISRIFEKSIKG